MLKDKRSCATTPWHGVQEGGHRRVEAIDLDGTGGELSRSLSSVRRGALRE